MRWVEVGAMLFRLRLRAVGRLEAYDAAREKRRARVQRDDVRGGVGQPAVANARLHERAAHNAHVREHRSLTRGAARGALRRMQTDGEVDLIIIPKYLRIATYEYFASKFVQTHERLMYGY